MKKSSFILVAALLGSTLYTGCNGGKGSMGANQPKITELSKMSSAELTDSAERLISPYSFMQAYKLANMALEKDPQNVKAGFIAAFLKRFEAFRGYLTRVRPILTVEQQKSLDERIKRLPKSPLKDFLTENAAPLTKLTDAQQILAAYFAGVRDFYQFLRTNQDASLQISYNPEAFKKELRDEDLNSCTGIEDKGLFVINCDRPYVVKKLAAADMIALRHVEAGELLYGALVNSYDLDGIEELMRPELKDLTPEEKWNHLLGKPKFATLRGDSLLGLVPQLAGDTGAAIEWALAHQNELCPQGKPADRKGYLLEHGGCVANRDEVQRSLDLLNQALKGVVEVDLYADGTKERINAFGFFRNPVSDLRAIRPLTYDKCGAPASFADDTLGGIFPDHNAVSVLVKKCDN